MDMINSWLSQLHDNGDSDNEREKKATQQSNNEKIVRPCACDKNQTFSSIEKCPDGFHDVEWGTVRR